MKHEIELFVINDLLTNKQKESAYKIILSKSTKDSLFGTVLVGNDVDTLNKRNVLSNFTHVVSGCRMVFDDNTKRYFVSITPLNTVSGDLLKQSILSGDVYSTDCDFAVFSGGNEEVIGAVLAVHLRKF